MRIKFGDKFEEELLICNNILQFFVDFNIILSDKVQANYASHPSVKSRVRIGRWRADALLQCCCSDIGAMYRNATGRRPMRTHDFTLGSFLKRDK